MFDNIKEFFRTIFKSRLLVAATVMVLLFSVLIFRMFQLQIIKGAEYQDNYTLKIVRERTLNSTRGNILDRNGEVLAYNELAYSITIEDNGSYDSTKEKNKLLNAEIADIITALEKNGDDIINNFQDALVKIILSTTCDIYIFWGKKCSDKRLINNAVLIRLIKTLYSSRKIAEYSFA